MRSRLLLLFQFLTAEHYDESLYLEPISGERVLTRVNFNFQTHSTPPLKHYRLYPRLIDEITGKLGVIELDLQLTRGQTEDISNVPYGAYLLATFDSDENVDKRWKSLVGQLAGLFCISLNQLDSGASFSPQWPLAGQLPVEKLGKSLVDPIFRST